jgi:hypothetical protein
MISHNPCSLSRTSERRGGGEGMKLNTVVAFPAINITKTA